MKREKTNVVGNSSPTIGSITQQHYRSFAIVLIFSCLGQSKSPGFLEGFLFMGWFYYSLWFIGEWQESFPVTGKNIHQ